MSKRILIVDDEPRYLRLLEANLRTEGYEVATAQDGVQALDVFSAQPIDLVLLDVMMPRLDGFGVCQRLREFSNVPIVILTARGEEQDRVRGLDLGADDYLVKPFPQLNYWHGFGQFYAARSRRLKHRRRASLRMMISRSISPVRKCGATRILFHCQPLNIVFCFSLRITLVRSSPLKNC